MCRYMTRGEKESCCINFGVMSEIIDKLPRFIPEKEKYHLSRAEAVRRFTEHNQKGYIGTIWYGPYPYINNLCSCKSPECAGIRPRMDFGIMSIHKAEYVADLHPACAGAAAAAWRRCPFQAIVPDTRTDSVRIDQEKCFGCGVCRHACDTAALFLAPRSERPALARQILKHVPQDPHCDRLFPVRRRARRGPARLLPVPAGMRARRLPPAPDHRGARARSVRSAGLADHSAVAVAVHGLHEVRGDLSCRAQSR